MLVSEELMDVISADKEKTEMAGFEPAVRLPAHSISNAAPSAAQPPLHNLKTES